MARRVAFLWGSNANRHYPTLKYAKRDVERLRAALSSKRYEFDVTVPRDTSNPHSIHGALLKTTAACAPEDVFVGYFSGHGLLVGSRLYLVLDGSEGDETQTMFSASWLVEAFQRCKARHRLLILDCCHAGAAAGVKSASVDVAELFPDSREERILYASGKLEAARELQELEGSFLTHSLCELLKRAPPGGVPLSRIVEGLQQTATDRNQNASLQQRVPVPYLSGAQRDEFFFAPPALRDSALNHHSELGTVAHTVRPGRRSPLGRALSSAWVGLRAAASDGQGAYFFTMLAFGLAAFFFHDSLATQHKGHDDLQRNIRQEQDPQRATRFPTFEGLVVPGRDDLCRNKALLTALEDTLEQAFMTFALDADDVRRRTELSRYVDRKIVEPTSRESYRINALYSVSADGASNFMVPSGGDASTPPELASVKDEETDPSLLCVGARSPGIAIATWTTPYFDRSRNGIVETICHRKAGEASSVRLCADVAIPEAAVFARLNNADAALEISTVRLPDGLCSTRQAPCDRKLAGMREMTEADHAIAKSFYDSWLKKAGPQAADAQRRASDTRGVWQEPALDVFGAVVYHQPSHAAEYWDIVLARARDSRTRNYVSLLLSAAFLVFAVSILVLGFRRKLRRQQFQLARGLHYGLLQLSDGKIVGASDRAEEILGTRLPRFGIDTERVQSAKTFAPMIHDVCVLLSSQGGPPSEASYDGKIRDRAADGLTSVFYAWVKRTQMWIKVTSTVILLPNDAEHVLCALDTAIDPLHKDLLSATRVHFNRRESGSYSANTA